MGVRREVPFGENDILRLPHACEVLHHPGPLSGGVAQRGNRPAFRRGLRVDLQEPPLHAYVEFPVETGETPLAHVAERSYVVGEHRYRQHGYFPGGHGRRPSSFAIRFSPQFEARRRSKVSGESCYAGRRIINCWRPATEGGSVSPIANKGNRK